jgi:hypothetical protein
MSRVKMGRIALRHSTCGGTRPADVLASIFIPSIEIRSASRNRLTCTVPTLGRRSAITSAGAAPEPSHGGPVRTLIGGDYPADLVLDQSLLNSPRRTLTCARRAARDRPDTREGDG